MPLRNGIRSSVRISQIVNLTRSFYMPQRFLKPGITGSTKRNACSYIAQSFYIRLLTLVDDFGRYEANPRYLASVTFPLSDDVDAAKMTELLAELESHELILCYKVRAKDYFQMTNWTERARAA